MIVTNEKNVSRGFYDNMWTSLLLGKGNTGSEEISIQVTHIQSVGEQSLHKHPEEQCYYIISGFGEMKIHEEKREVNAGDAIFIPGNFIHGIRNLGQDELIYLTANKAFGEKAENLIWNDVSALKQSPSIPCQQSKVLP